MKNILILCILLVIGATFALSQDTAYSPEQKKIMARRAAILDGYRQLAETIKGVKILSQTTVKDFMAENDTIEAKLAEFTLRGATVVATRYMPDGNCEVDMVFTMADLILCLKNLQKEYNLENWSGVNFEDISKYNEIKVFRVTGAGAPPEGMSGIQIQNLHKENVALKEELVKFKQQILAVAQMQEKRYYELAQNSESDKKELDKVRKEIKKFQEMLVIYQGYQEQYQQALSENKSLKEQINQTAQKIQEIQAINNSNLEYKTKYEELMKKYQSISEDIGSMQQQLTEMVEVKHHLSQALADISRLKKENNDLRYVAEKHKTCVKEADGLRKQREILTKERNKLQIEAGERQNTIQELTRQNEEMKAEMEHRKGNSFWNQVSPEQKLMAKRAALLDAYSQLIDMIQGLKINATTTVKDLVTTEDSMYAELQSFIKGAHIVEVRYFPNGICEVDVEIALSHFAEFLASKAKLSNGKSPHFSQISEINNLKQIQATGMGTWNK